MAAHNNGEMTLNYESHLRALSEAIVTQELGLIERSEYGVAPEYTFSEDDLILHNPLVRYLVEMIFKTQQTTKLMVEAFGEYAEEVEQEIEQFKAWCYARQAV